MPKALVNRGGGDTEVYFDFRGFYRRRALWEFLTITKSNLNAKLRAEAKRWRSVRDFEEEVGKLAARLTCDALGDEASLSSIEDSYIGAIRRDRRWRKIKTACAIGLAAAALFAVSSSIEKWYAARVSNWIESAESLSEALGPGLIDALGFCSKRFEGRGRPKGEQGAVSGYATPRTHRTPFIRRRYETAF